MSPLASRAGTSRTSIGAVAEGFEREAEPASARRRGSPSRAARVGVEFDHFGDQQHLPLDAAIGERGFQLFIDQALMRGVLVDDDDGMAGLGDDIGLVELGAGGAERVGQRIGGRRLAGRRRRWR